ncbi:MAG: hypothetical protein IJ876_06625, partial [Elusimicrobiaceae bacterium]|nr:hypothetical protein [Elusimicrobiaceae bacterium]
QTCNTCGTQTRTVSCNTSTGKWNVGAWGNCSKTQDECVQKTCKDVLGENYIWDVMQPCEQPHQGNIEGKWLGYPDCKCSCPQGSTLIDGECEETCENKLGNSYSATTQKCTKATSTSVAGTWDDTKCACKCPADFVLKNGQCVCPSGYTLKNGSCQRESSCSWEVTEDVTDFATGTLCGDPNMREGKCPGADASGGTPTKQCTTATKGSTFYTCIQYDTCPGGGWRQDWTRYECQCN